MEESTEGRLLHAKFHPISACWGVEYKRPAWAYPLRDFVEIFGICARAVTSWVSRLNWGDLLKGFRSLWGSTYGVPFSLKFSALPRGETIHQMRKSFGGTKAIRISSIKSMPSFVGVGFRALLGTRKFDVFNFFCLSVTILNGKLSEHACDRRLKPFERKYFIAHR